MKIIVMGAGVVGVTCAYQLAKDGHEVIVVDEAQDVASIASLGNAGLLSAGHAFAWASPRAPGMMMRSLWRNDQKIRFSLKISPAQWIWALKFLRECSPQRSRENSDNMQRLAKYSLKMLENVVKETGVEFDLSRSGLLYVYRKQKSCDLGAEKVKLLKQNGIEAELLDRDDVVKREPNFAKIREEIMGALYAPGDMSGDSNLFTVNLAKACKKLGVKFRLGERIISLEQVNGEIKALITDKDRLTADQYVTCLGVHSRHILKSLGINLPIYPVKGFSVTFPMIDASKGPGQAGVDEDNLLAFDPLGDRLRLTSIAEIGGYNTSYAEKDFQAIIAGGKELFDGAADFTKPTYWAGLRPMTPKCMPVIDRSPIDNLWLNTGHGHLGWTMACGSAKILSDLVRQRQPEIDRKGMRYGD